MTRRGLGPFFAFEGIDGSGKSTALAHVAAELADTKAPQGHDWRLLVTREETSGPAGVLVRQSIAEKWDPVATALLFAADRARHLQELGPHLEKGGMVLCDRFVHSTYAYQGVTLQGHVPDPDAFLRSLHAGWCIEPSHVVLLTVDPEEAVRRVAGRGAATNYEKADFLRRVQERYLAMAKADPKRFTVIDANRPQPDVLTACSRAVWEALR